MTLRLIGVVASLCIAQSAAAQVAPRDTSRRAVLAGIVRDSLGRTVAMATVTAEETRTLSVVTDSSGSFVLRGLPADTVTISVMKIGYQPVSFGVTLLADSAVHVNVMMRPTPTLPSVNVSGQSARLARDGFYERQRTGWGRYLTPEEIKNKAFVMTPSGLLRDQPGLRLNCDQGARRATGGGCIVRGPSNTCMALWVNGVHIRGELDQMVATNDVYAMEIYIRGSSVPIEFKRPNTDRCGAIIVWTTSRKP